MYRMLLLIALLASPSIYGQTGAHLFETGFAWHGVNSSGIEGQVGYGKEMGVGPGTGHYGALLGAEWQPSSNMVGWSGQLFYSFTINGKGVNLRPSYVLYQRGGLNLPVIRPEAGFSYNIFSVNYGYNLWLNDPVVSVPYHRLILRVQMPFGVGGSS